MPSSKAEPSAQRLPIGGRPPAGLLALLVFVPLVCHPDFTDFAPPKTFVLLAILGVATLVAATRGMRLIQREPLFLIGATWTLWQLAHLPFVVDPIRGAVATATSTSAWLIALLIARSYPSARVPQRPLGLALTVGALVAMVALCQIIGWDLLGLGRSGGTPLEAIGTLGNTNHLSEYLVPILLVGIVIISVLPGGLYRTVAFASTLLIAGAIGAAQARAAAVALGTGFGVLLLGWLRFRWSRPLATRRRAAWALVGLGIVGTATGVALFDASSGSARVRVLVWQRSLDLWHDHALAGIGPGQFLIEFPTVRDPEEIALSSPGHTTDTVVSTPHNEVVSALVESGFLGALLLAAVFCLSIWRLTRFLQHARPARAEAWLALGLLGALAAAAANALLSSPLTRNPSALVVTALLVGCAFAVSSAPEPSPSRARPLERGGVAVLGVLLLLGGGWGFWQQVIAARAWQADRDGDYLGAVEGLRAAVSLDPSDARSRSRLAHLLGGLGRVNEAITEQRAVITWRPNSPAAWITLGAFEASADLRPAAALSFKRALELDDSDPRVHANLARLVRLDQGPGPAFPFMQRAARLAPRYASELKQWGEALLESDDTENAARYLDAYLQHEPNDAEAWISLSRVMRARRDLDSAEKFSTRGHFLFGREYLGQARRSLTDGPADAAAEQLRQAERQLKIATRFDHLEAHLYLAVVQLERGNRENALETVHQARAIGGSEALRITGEHPELERLMSDSEFRAILEK